MGREGIRCRKITLDEFAANSRIATVMSLLPLFPLDTVLLPGIRLPLHIFEQRYREMVAECIEASRPFGVVRARESTMAEMGCTAEIVEVTKKYDDGRYDIVTVGKQRFEVLEVNRERNFLQGRVAFIEDDPEEDAEGGAEQRKQALELFEAISEILGNEETIDTASPCLSFQIAGALPIDLDFKQALLDIRSENERLLGLVEFFEAIMPKLKKASRRREKAGGNGHVP
jgi:Lon protease-like protein